MHAIVGNDADQVGVEGCVMDLRQRQSIGHNGLSQLLVGVRNDVCGVEQPFLRQSGKQTAAPMGTDHRLQFVKKENARVSRYFDVQLELSAIALSS